MSSDSSPPKTKNISEDCPNPDIVAHKKVHFGSSAWEWHCQFAKEVIVDGKGIEIRCSRLDQICCIDDNQRYFVNSSSSEPLRLFFNTTLKYFGIKTAPRKKNKNNEEGS